MKQLGSAIEKLLRNYNLWQGYQQHSIIEKWADIVGSALAEATRAEKVANGILFVAVKDSVWAYHLSMLKPQLIKKLNNHVGSKIIRDIYFYIENLKIKD